MSWNAFQLAHGPKGPITRQRGSVFWPGVHSLFNQSLPVSASAIQLSSTNVFVGEPKVAYGGGVSFAWLHLDACLDGAPRPTAKLFCSASTLCILRGSHTLSHLTGHLKVSLSISLSVSHFSVLTRYLSIVRWPVCCTQFRDSIRPHIEHPSEPGSR